LSALSWHPASNPSWNAGPKSSGSGALCHGEYTTFHEAVCDAREPEKSQDNKDMLARERGQEPVSLHVSFMGLPCFARCPDFGKVLGLSVED
jgi:hypothetical protein